MRNIYTKNYWLIILQLLNSKNACLSAAFFFVLLIRVICSNAKCISTDEAALLYIASYPIWDIIGVMEATGEVHPPGYFYFAHFWQYVSHEEIWLRLSSVIFSSISVATSYFLALEMSNSKKTALYSAALLGVSAFGISLAVEYRMYSFLQLSFISAIFLSVKLAKANENKTSLSLSLALLNLIGCLTHHLFIFCLPIQVYCLLMYSQKGTIKRNAYCFLLPFSSFLSSLFFIFCKHLSVQDMTIRDAPDLWHVIMLFSKLLIGNGFPQGFMYGVKNPWHEPLLICGIIGILAFSISFIKFKKKNYISFLTTSFYIISIVSLSAFTSIKIFEYKYFIIILPFFLYSIAVLISNIKNKKIELAAISLIVILNAYSAAGEFLNPNLKGQDWKIAAKIIEEKATDGTAIVVTPSMMSLPLNYYLKSPFIRPANHIDEELIKELSYNDYFYLCIVPYHKYCVKHSSLIDFDSLFIKEDEEYVYASAQSDIILIIKYRCY